MTRRDEMHRPDTPRGQVLLITAFGIVVLMLVAALVIDIGFSVMLRRQEQNAADPGALAAARFIRDDQTIDMPKAREAACYYARQNGFFPSATDNTGCIPANDPSAASLVLNYPPNGDAGDFSFASGMVQVIISREQETFFGRVIGVGRLTVATDAVAARQRGETNTNSLVALDPESCNSANVHGTGSIEIYAVPGYEGLGGFVHVKSDCGSGTSDDDCSNGTGALKIDGTATLIAPKVNVRGSCQGDFDQPVGVLDEAASQIMDPLAGLVPPLFDPNVDGARCGSGGQATQATGPRSTGCGNNPMDWFVSPVANCPGILDKYKCVELQPGVYYGGWDLSSAKYNLKLAPGIYIIAGGGIDLTTDAISSVIAAGSGPAPVLIFNTDNPKATCPGSASGCQDDLTLGTAQSTLKIAGLLRGQPCPPVSLVGGCPFGGMVIWYDPKGSQGYDGQISVQGGAGLYISGTIYAPKAFVDIEGHAGTNCGTGTETQVASVQIISWDWRLGGSGTLCMPYDPTQLYKLNYTGLVH
ncbi:MAG: pilus assembly protein TadG-related protein [Candidatus Limnocylindria bacterium]